MPEQLSRHEFAADVQQCQPGETIIGGVGDLQLFRPGLLDALPKVV